MAQSDEQRLKEEASATFLERVRGMEISTDSIILILQYAMETMEATKLTGDAKKAHVIDMVRRLIVDAPMDNHTEAVLLEMVDDGIVSHIVDIIVSATRGKVNLNAALGAGGVLCSNLMPLISRCIPCNTAGT